MKKGDFEVGQAQEVVRSTDQAPAAIDQSISYEPEPSHVAPQDQEGYNEGPHFRNVALSAEDSLSHHSAHDQEEEEDPEQGEQPQDYQEEEEPNYYAEEGQEGEEQYEEDY